MSKVETSTTACSKDCTPSVSSHAHQKSTHGWEKGSCSCQAPSLCHFQQVIKQNSSSNCSDKYVTEVEGECWLKLVALSDQNRSPLQRFLTSIDNTLVDHGRWFDIH